MGWCSIVQAQQPVPKTQPVEKAHPTPKSQSGANASMAKGSPTAPQAPSDKSADSATSKPQDSSAKAKEPTAAGAATSSSEQGEPATKREGESWVPGSSGSLPNNAGSGTQDPASPWPDTANTATTGAGNNAPVYYVDRPPAERAPGAAATSGHASENAAADTMRFPIEEPPVPPPQRHSAPRSALWMGARVGYFVPFGDLWGRCAGGYSACDTVEGVSFGDVAASGPMFELDVGARLGRNYVIYLGWERAQLGSAGGPSPDSSVAVNQRRSESDFLALGFRLASDPDDIGLVLDLAVGARRFRAYYENSTELQLTQAPLESRLGIGVDIRTNRKFTLSPMITLGIGSFGKADWVKDQYIQNALPTDSDRLTHGWVTLQLGGHFDLLGSD